MQRILNDPDNIVDEMLSGFLKANSDIVEATENKRVVKARCKGEGKVGVITGGGSGHKPAFIGYVGENMCDKIVVQPYRGYGSKNTGNYNHRTFTHFCDIRQSKTCGIKRVIIGCPDI